ncbi:MAG TPA: hypothetical protein VMB71_07840 [Acetobacteraceae bacterium]|nr:hypothetical protein [Acetobacteraceae bacterium]
MSPDSVELALREYKEVNAHLRANTAQFVNWFSFFLISNFAAAILYLAYGAPRQGWRGVALNYGVPVAVLLLHFLAFLGIIVFRRYIGAADRKLAELVAELGETRGSPVPLRFSRWMTHLMAAGFVISYFAWFTLLFVR